MTRTLRFSLVLNSDHSYIEENLITHTSFSDDIFQSSTMSALWTWFFSFPLLHDQIISPCRLFCISRIDSIYVSFHRSYLLLKILLQSQRSIVDHLRTQCAHVNGNADSSYCMRIGPIDLCNKSVCRSFE